MSFRFALGGAFALLVSACTGGPNADSSAAARECSRVMAESAAYVQQHAAAREEKLKVIRFASEAAMNAYNAKTRELEAEAEALLAGRNALEARYGLAGDAQAYTFDHTTDEEAEARIAAAKTCAAPLTE